MERTMKRIFVIAILSAAFITAATVTMTVGSQPTLACVGSGC
jgi:hypothetical protein